MGKPSTKATPERVRPRETSEAPGKGGMTLEELNDRAKKIESEPNVNAADAIRKLEGNKKTVEQLDGLLALRQAINRLLVKLIKKGVDISKISKPEELNNYVTVNAILADNLPEATTLDCLPKILEKQGETSDNIRESWAGQISDARESSKGYGTKYLESLKRDPVGTIALTAAGAAGAYLAYNLVAFLTKKAFGVVSKETGKDTPLWARKEVLIPAATIILGAGGYLGKDAVARILSQAGLDYGAIVDKAKKGQEFTPDEQSRMQNAGDRLSQMVGQRAQGVQRPGTPTPAPAPSGTDLSNEPAPPPSVPAPKAPEGEEEGAEKDPGEISIDGQRLTNDEVERKTRYEVTTLALTHLYVVSHNEEKLRDVEHDIPAVFNFIGQVPVGKVVEAFDRAQIKKSEEISPSELGISAGLGVSDKALYHTCAIISTAFKEAEKISKTYKPSRTDTIETFMAQLGNDPALGISNEVQKEVATKIAELKITSLAELHDSAEKVFDTKAIENVFEVEKIRFIEYLATKYQIDLSNLDKDEKASFIAFIVSLYARGIKLNQPEEAIDQLAGFNALNPKVKKVSKDFFKALKADVAALLPQVVARYDIQRKDDEKYNQVLSKHLKLDMLLFKDGLQMALLSDGIDFSGPTQFESVGQAKDITMLYLMVNILKQRSPTEAYPLYVSNLIDLGSKSKIDLKLNLNFEKLQPYFQQLFDILLSKSKNWAIRVHREMMGLSDMNYDPEKIQKLSQMTVWEFAAESGRSGVRGAYGIPAELVRVLAGEFPGSLEAHTTGEEVLKQVLSLGGTISFPVGREGMGLVYLFGKYYFIRPFGVLWDSTSALLQKGPGVAAKTYLLGTSPFIILGAGSGALRAAAVHHGQIWRVALGGVQGASRGLLTPVSMPIQGYRYMRAVVRGGQYSYNVIRGRTVANFEMSAEYFLKYHDLVSKESAGKFQKLKAWKERPMMQARKLLFRDVYDSMRVRWAHYSAVNYNDFWGLNPELPVARTGKTLQAIAIRDTAFYSSENFIQAIQRMSEVLENLRKIEDMEKLSEAELFEKFKEAGLKSEEINTLRAKLDEAKKADKVKGFEKFKKSLAKQLAKDVEEAGEVKPSLFSRLRERFGKKPGAEGGEGEAKEGAEAGEPKAGEAEAAAEPEKPVRVGKSNKYRYKGEEFEVTRTEIKKMKRTLNTKSDAEAVEALCEKKWNTPRFLRRTAEDNRVYRYQGEEYTLTPAECKNSREIEAAVKTKQAASAAPAEPPKPSAGPEAGGEPPKVASEVGEPGGISRWERIKRNFLGESLSTAGGPDKALKNVGENLEEVRKEIAAADKTMTDVQAARAATTQLSEAEATALQARYDAASRIAEEGRALETQLDVTTKALQKVKNAETALDAVKATKNVAEIAKLQTELRSATHLAEDAMKSSRLALEEAGRASRVLRYGKTALRGAGNILAGAGVLVSGFEAITSGYEALTTDVAGRGTIKGLEAGMWTVNLVADGAAMAVLFGAESASLTVASSAALPLMPLTYAGTAIFDTLNEDTKTSAEWVQGSPAQALHAMYSAMNTCSLGDAWISAFAPESRIRNQKETLHKIFRGLVAIQKDPTILSLIYDGKSPSEEKTKQIQSKIDGNYTVYHEFFFRNANLTQVQTYASARQMVLDAQLFDEIMQKRDEAVKKGLPFILMGNDKMHPFTLSDKRYNVVGGMDNPHAEEYSYNPADVVQAYKETMSRLLERDPIRKGNLDRMDSAYLMRLYMQIALALEDKDLQSQIEGAKGLKGELSRQALQISNYLKTARGMDMTFAMMEPSYREPRMSVEEIMKHLNGISSVTNAAYLEYEKANYSMTPAVNALYRLGEHFGYAGPPREKELKDFFHKEAASFHGVYWDGSEWRLQMRGWDKDKAFGAALTSEVIEKMIVTMREQPDNILEHRQDSIFLDAHDYSVEVGRMAEAMEKGLTEGNQRGYQGRNEGRRGAEMAVQYQQPKESLTQSYRDTIEKIKGLTNWSHLQYNVENENSIVLSRSDGGATCKLTRSGTSWTVGENYKSGLTLMQAVTLGNLKNWAEQWLKKENIKGGSGRPFAIDGDAIDFDVAGTPFDRDFIKGWLGFYGDFGVTREMTVDTLNNWYFNDVNHRAVEVGFFG